jgi:hypothetical protein
LDENELFNALLVQVVTDPKTTWEDAVKQLERDDRWLDYEILEADRKTLLQEHIVLISRKKERDNFRVFLEASLDLLITNKWKKAKKQLVQEPAYIANEMNHEWVSLIFRLRILQSHQSLSGP